MSVRQEKWPATGDGNANYSFAVAPRQWFGLSLCSPPALSNYVSPAIERSGSLKVEKMHEGSCLCGDVRYEVRGEFEHFFLCHCGRCRKGSGSAHGANLFSSTAKIAWLAGEENVKEYALPDTLHSRAFCSKCGAPVPGIQMDGALVVVPAGSLDSAIDIRPEAHICVASRAKWDRQLEDVPEIDAFPT